MGEKVSLSRQELHSIAKTHFAFRDIPLNRMSAVLIGQLLSMEAGRLIYIEEVTQEIRALEAGGSSSHTKPEDAFSRHKHLKGFKKKHFTSARFLSQNIGAYWGIANGRKGNQKLDELCQAFAEQMATQKDWEMLVSQISHEFTIGAYEKRFNSKNMTGEWIVFDDRSGERLYLTLASHSENDDAIWERVMFAIKFDFPQLMES
ncbi:hypothetical protein [Thalassospira povalilytica]|uniref:hypothetical protein n=1 Tax=Thalassospira povalilytica TaxID=732237 RepID=UPI003AA8A483